MDEIPGHESIEQGLSAALDSQIAERIDQAMTGFREKLEQVVDLERLRRKALLTPAEVEKLYGLKANTLETWRCRGGGPDYTKVGASVFYTNEALNRFIEERRVLGHA